MSGSGLRIDGLATGMDTTGMINQLMAVERQPITLLQQRRLDIQARGDAWRDVTSRVENLKSAASSLLQRGSIVRNMVSLPGGTTTPPLSASADSTAVAGSYSITISQLATGSVARSVAPLGAEVVSADALSTANLAVPITAGAFTINDVSISVDPATDSLDDVIGRVNASAAGVTASIVRVNGRDRLALSANSPGGPLRIGSAGDASNFLSATKLLATPRVGDTITGSGSLGVAKLGDPLVNAKLATPVSGSGALTVNGVDIAYNADTESLNTIISRINASAAGVSASYDTVNDRFVLQNKQTGSVSIGLSDTGGLLTALGVAGAAAQTLGANAAYSLDGGATTRYSASNTVNDAISGVTLNLTAASATPTTFSVQPDPAGAVDAIKKFVEQYNSTLNFIRDKTAYDATTKKGGTLLGDGAARDLERSLRQMVINPAIGVGGPYTSLNALGINFGAIGSKVGTTDNLQVDETKLRAALTANPSAVFQVLGAKNTASLTAAGDVAAISGTPTGLTTSGRYAITSDGAGQLTATLYDANNAVLSTKTETVAAGGVTSTLVEGLTLTAATTYSGAPTSIAVVNQQGVMANLDQYLGSALADQGILTLGSSTADSEIKQVDDSVKTLQDRLDAKQARLVQQFSTMEQLVAKMQAQSSALSSQLAGLISNR